MKFRQLVLGASLTLLTIPAAHAEFLGLLNGRSANPGSLPPLSVEGAFITGDDYQHFGARVNYTLSPELSLFGDVGQTEFQEDFDGLSFGIGAFYHLANQQMLANQDISVKGSFHMASLEADFDRPETTGNAFVDALAGAVADASDLDINVISLEAIVSGREALTPNGLMWYANAGLNLLGGDLDETELLLGGGVTLPTGPGEVYAGADFIDKLKFGIGYRYHVQ